MNFEAKLQTLMNRYDELNALLETETDGAQIVKLSKEQSALEDVVMVGREWIKTIQDMKGAEEMMNDPEADSEMKALASEEFYDLKAKLPDLEQIQQYFWHQTKQMLKTLFWKSERERAAKKRRFLRRTYSVCMNVMRRFVGGVLKCKRKMKQGLAA